MTKNIHILSTFVGRRDAIAAKVVRPATLPDSPPASRPQTALLLAHCAVQLRVFWADLRRVINFVDSAVAVAAAACTGSDIIIIVIVILMLIIAQK